MNVRKHKVVPFTQPITSGGVGSVLALMFRRILKELGLDSKDRYDSLMMRFIQRATLLPDPEKKVAMRQGLATELLKESITWKTLMRGLEFLAIDRFRLAVILHHRDGTESTHSIDSPLLDEKTAGTVLSGLLKNIFFDLGITGSQYNELMEQYIDRSRTTIHRLQRATIRASTSKELLKHNVTWKTFFKGLSFIDIPRFKLVMTLFHSRGKVTTHEVAVRLDDDEPEEAA